MDFVTTDHRAVPPPTLLIVDDDSATREGLARLLSDDGFRVLTADSFERAVDSLKTKAPDLLLLDVRLGEFNGLQLLVTAPRSIPAIVMTGYADNVLERDARQLGAEYLVKPITHDSLLAAIERRLPAPESRERRWMRKQPSAALPTWVNRLPGQLLDLSYGGVRLEVDDAPDDLPSSLAVAVPGSEQFIHVEVVWSVRQRERCWQLGAAVVDDDASATQEWRELVDSV
jgi:CheY-like chemotaxis protein